MARRFAAIAAQVALLWFMSWVGHEIVALLNLPRPGSVAGLLLTLLSLSHGVPPLCFVEQGAGPLVRNLPLFVVPLTVGFLPQWRLPTAHGFALLAARIGSAAGGFAVTGRLAQFVTHLLHDATVAARRPHAETRLARR